MKLQDNPRFQEDYKTYQAEISAVTDEKTKKELTEMLVNFLRQVSSIDQQHTQLLFSNKLPADVADARLKLNESKKKLDAGIKNWKRKTQSV